MYGNTLIFYCKRLQQYTHWSHHILHWHCRSAGNILRPSVNTLRLTKLWISTQWSCTGAVTFKCGLKYVCSYYIINKANWLRTQTPFFSFFFYKAHSHWWFFFIIQFQPIRGLQYIYSIYYFSFQIEGSNKTHDYVQRAFLYFTECMELCHSHIFAHMWKT